MSVNSSNSSLPPHPLTPSLNIYNFVCNCVTSTAGSFSITAITIFSILFLLPLYILVLYVGHQRWRQQRSSTAMSHSDLFTYHIVIIELMTILGSILSCCAAFTGVLQMLRPGIYLLSVNVSGQMFFHLLTCVERYLAVVHPVTYLGLRKASVVRIRNITIGCVWLLCLTGTANCLNYRSSFFIFTAFSVTNILLLLPPCILIIYVGLQRWLKNRSALSSHSDMITYHMVAMEMIGIFGCGIYFCGACINMPRLMVAGTFLVSVTSHGQIFFHMLTCAELHLAVVYPITYLSLRTRGGVRIRNVTIGCIWLLFFGLCCRNILFSNITTISNFTFSVLSIVVVSFCSLSVLYTLIRPGPGEGGGNRDRSKMRAFYTIMAIMGALLLRFGGNLLILSIHATLAVKQSVRCVVLVSGVWFCIPSSLVLPLLFLHRAGKLLCMMSVNSSNSSLPPHPLTQSFNYFNFVCNCITSTAGSFSITAFTIFSILFLLPLYILVLYVGHQRWRQQRSSTAMSHSDLFTYHSVIIELINILGSILSCCAAFTGVLQMLRLGIYLVSINVSGQIFFHFLTCVERYLAVVHPVTYLGLRKASGIKIRNITIGCVWLLCLAGTGLMSVEDNGEMAIVASCISVLNLIIISFCSLHVLCVLIRPKPGEGGVSRQQVHHSKLRAFYTMMAILGVLVLRMGWSVVVTALLTLPQRLEIDICSIWLCTSWVCLPSSLVLPLLFLHRAGKLPCLMSVNSSNSSLPPHPLTQSFNYFNFVCNCITSTAGSFSITAFTIFSILFLLPLYILVLYVGHQRWRQQRSSTAMSHSDLFTYHSVIIELINILGSILSCCAAFTGVLQMLRLGIYLVSINVSGQIFFHFLTCVERYLAVVHPVTYLGLRKASGIKIRNITIGCVWLLCLAGTGLMSVEDNGEMAIVASCISVLNLIIISFCSLHVLCVLIRPKPGEGGVSRQQVHHSKLRAFYTMMAILGVLVLRMGWSVVVTALLTLPQRLEIDICSIWLCTSWVCLPSSLVLPLLFLHRAGKLPCLMSVNSSNSSLPPHPLTPSLNIYNFVCNCITSTAGSFSITAFTIFSILFLLPLYILVLYVGHQRWRQQRSSTAMSHSDLFTYHSVIIELINILGSILSCCAAFTGFLQMLRPGIYLLSINVSGQMFFHLLTCVERYLAVVHPVTYLGLRRASVVKIRNITIGCVWLLCLAGTGLMSIEDNGEMTIVASCISVLNLIIISFCSLHVLCVLIRPKPGEGGVSRQQVHHSKLRAFYTMMAILGVLVLRVGWSVVVTTLLTLDWLEIDRCSIWSCAFWICLPSSLVLPLLFLHRAGKLPCLMSVNSSNSSLPPHPLTPSLNIYNFVCNCIKTTAGSFSITAFTIFSILFLLPLYILVLYVGHQRWRQQRSSTAMSHSDLFTYHTVIIELMNILGSILSCCAAFTGVPEMIIPGIYLLSINISGQIFFHLLTCVERYLAVVHPVTYLGLRKASVVRIRNITIGCVWLLCLTGTGLMSVEDTRAIIIPICFFSVISFIIISFCSLHVLCVLIRPKPGEGGVSRQQVHHSKLVAFYTMMAILGVLVLRFGANVFIIILHTLPKLGDIGKCGLWLSTSWVFLPSSLVLPLLFLHRAGKLPCCKNNTGSG
ncbi:hypothetical protein PAMA_013657 [Pampus argenteus]